MVPVAAYRRDSSTRTWSRRAVGTHLPLPWIQDMTGKRAPLADVLGNVEWACDARALWPVRVGRPRYAVAIAMNARSA